MIANNQNPEMHGNFSNLVNAARYYAKGVGSEHSAFRRGSPKVGSINLS